MPQKKRFYGNLNCHIHANVETAIRTLAEEKGLTQSEVARDLLLAGLRTKGIEC